VQRAAGFEALDLETRVTLDSGAEQELDLQPTGQTTLRGAIEYLTELPAGTQTAGYGPPPTFGPPASGMPPVVVLLLERLGRDGPLDTERRGGFAHDGHFELEGLAAGDWTISATLVHADGTKAQVNKHVEVPASGALEIQLGVLNFLRPNRGR
jgi:hypothetical protein